MAQPLPEMPAGSYSTETDMARDTTSRSGPATGSALVPVGVALTLVGLVGDLLAHTISPTAHAHEELIVLGRGNNPWHLVLFAGILLTALGGIRWSARLPSEWGALLGAGIALLLVATVILGGWAGWQARGEQAAHANQITLAGGGVDHGSHGSTGVPDQATAVVPGAPASDLAGASHQAHGANPEGESLFGGHSHGAAGPTTDQDWVVMGQQLAASRAASAKYRDIAVAKAAGYFQVTQFIPGLGLHLVNLGISQERFDPAKPQILLYEPTGSGGFRLAGVGYAFTAASPVPPVGFAGGTDVWHYHERLCFLPNGSVTITPDAASCHARSGVFQRRTAWLLHAWIWVQNPQGVFTEYNPKVF
jgi:hypothetical protein